MALRGSSPIASEFADRSYDSSPDPLAISFNENKATAGRKTPAKAPLRASTPSKQNRRGSMSEVAFSSPSKSLIMSTPRMGSASPWRIKVTVQAEPGTDDENEQSPSMKHVTYTKTTTIPLKDPDAPSPTKRPRGRPRKSDVHVGESARTKRSGTPLKKAPRSISRDTSIGAADVDTDVPPKRRRGRPRKSIQPEFENASPQPLTPSHQERRNVASYMPPQEESRRYMLAKKGTPLRTDSGQKLRARKGTPHSKHMSSFIVSTGEDSDNDSAILTPTSGDQESDSNRVVQDLSVRGMTRVDLNTPNDSASTQSGDQELGERFAANDQDVDLLSPEGFEDEDDDDVQDVTNFAFEDGTTRMPDDTVLLDSENFSMISVDSLHNNGASINPASTEVPRVESLLQHEYLISDLNDVANSGPQTISQTSSALLHPLPGRVSIDSLRLASSPRYKTPFIDAETLSVPPAIEPVRSPVMKNETPRLGRVVTAGVALQGVLDPGCHTPEPSQKVLDEKHDRLDDLFRGFSEGTRKELQAGLRLGEQLAQSPTREQSLPKAQPEVAPKEGFRRTHRKYRQSRLLTPEEQDAHLTPPAEQSLLPSDVQYPDLDVAEVESALLSPAGSENEMSWRADTPPVSHHAGERRRLDTYQNEHEDTTCSAQPPSITDGSKQAQLDDYADIWQEEASRSSNSAEAGVLSLQRSPRSHHIFADEGLVEPARGKLPRTWRRRSGNNFHYSDEMNSPEGPRPTREEYIKPTWKDVSAGTAKLINIDSPEGKQKEREDEDAGSDTSDDTGMFFQSNLPNTFSKERPSQFRQRKAGKLDLAELLKEGESLVPDSSPPVMGKKSSSATDTNPFLDTPPRFTGFPSSPKKSSPLRMEVRGSNISFDTPQPIEEESTLPLAQSSPFHTFVDGVSYVSTASDQRQFRVEMEGSTASTIQRVRNEANKYLDAYEPQERSLNEITEVTEPSRMWHQDTDNPSQKKHTVHQSLLYRNRPPVPLFSEVQRPEQRQSAPNRRDEQREDADVHCMNTESEASSHSTGNQQQPSTGLFGLITSSLVSTFSRPAPSLPPKPHPILSRFTPLPKVEPWTKTHYKALDKLYAYHAKHPALFSPSVVPATPLSRTNAALLKRFLSTNQQPYVGATLSAWGYELVLTEDLVILCAVYMELMTLADIAQYEQRSGRVIQMGDCAPGRSGDAIKGDEVVRRLATVVLGDAVRSDERAGVTIDRKQKQSMDWPQ